MAKTRSYDKAQRRAAGHTVFVVFHIVLTASHTLRAIGTPQDKFKAGTVRYMGKGLSKKERAFVLNLAGEMDTFANKLQRLGWLLLKGTE